MDKLPKSWKITNKTEISIYNFPAIKKKEFRILTFSKNVIFYNDTFIKIVWRHGRKEINICMNM